jgi:hypothetical protein
MVASDPLASPERAHCMAAPTYEHTMSQSVFEKLEESLAE